MYMFIKNLNIPNSLISSVNTPGSLSIKHQFPALSVILRKLCKKINIYKCNLSRSTQQLFDRSTGQDSLLNEDLTVEFVDVKLDTLSMDNCGL